MAEIIGQCFSIMASYVYDTPPRYLKGHGIVLGFIGMAIISSVCLIIYMARENKRRDRVEADYAARGEVHPDIGKSLEEVYDYHISFRYIL